MRKHKKQSQPPAGEGVQSDHPHSGDNWGIMHVLKYHHWHYVKKKLPHRKHGGGKHDTNSNKQDTGDETKNSGDNTRASEAEHLPLKPPQDVEASSSKVKGKKRNPGPVLKDSVKFILKVMKEEKSKGREEKSKRKGKHRRSKTCPEHSRASDMEPKGPEHGVASKRIEIDEKILKAIRPKNDSSFASSSLSDVSPQPPKEEVESSENSDQKALVEDKGKQLLDKDVLPLDDHKGEAQLTAKFLTGDAFSCQAKEIMDALDIISMNKEFLLTILQDPGSPLAQHFQKQQATSAKMALRRCESFPLAGSHNTKIPRPNRLKNHNDAGNDSKKGEVVMPFKLKELPKNMSLKKFCRSSSAGATQNRAKTEMPDGFYLQLCKKVNENQVVIRRFKDLRHKIKHVVNESKQEKRRITMDAVFDKIPKDKDISDDMRKETMGLYKKGDNLSLPFNRNKTVQHFERSPSLKESMDRYLQLYESSFQKEANQQTLDRQMSRKEDAFMTNSTAKKFLVRMSSSPELHSYIPHNDQDFSGLLSPDREINAQNSTECLGLTLDDPSQIKQESKPKTDQDASNQLDFSSSQEVKLNTKQNSLHLEAIDYSATMQVELDKAELLSKDLLLQSDIPQVQVDEKHEASFNYVKDVLHLAGFNCNEFFAKWHANDQPLNPSMVEEVEGCMLHDPNCPGNEKSGYCSHLIMFDLINEVLLEIYEGSYSYSPVLLSRLSKIRPKPIGKHVLEEVWIHISWYLSFRTGKEQKLDYVLSRDLMKKDGWMNMQFDMECIGLELEELIFYGLLKELVSDSASSFC